MVTWLRKATVNGSYWVGWAALTLFFAQTYLVSSFRWSWPSGVISSMASWNGALNSSEFSLLLLLESAASRNSPKPGTSGQSKS